MNRNLKIAALVTVVFLNFPGTKVDASELLAFYEISAEVNGNSTVIRTSKPVEFGAPITHEFGEYQTHMIFEPAESDQFTLAVSLNAIAPTTNAVVYTMLSESFEGQISSDQELSQSAFTIDEDGISISIVLRLTQIQQ